MLDNDSETLLFIKDLIDNSIVKKVVKTKIIENELNIICDDNITVYKLSIRS